MTYIPKHVFRGGDELPPDVPSPSAQEWDEFMAGILETVKRKGSWQDYLDQDDEYDPEDRLERSIQ